MGKKYSKEELIGLRIRIIQGTTECIGTILDETKNLIIIMTDENQKKKFIKSNSVLWIEGKKILGSDLAYRPEDRIRK